MSSPGREIEEPSSSNDVADSTVQDEKGKSAASESARPPAKRRLSSTVIEISDTESDDSDVCAVNSYQASADEVKRIRGADYSSSSSSSDYSSDSESPWEDDSVLVEDAKSDGNVIRVQLNNRANRMDDPKFNSKIKTPEIIETMTSHWKEEKNHSNEEITLTCSPFRLCLLHNFLDNPEIINNIVDDMNTLDWSRKKMDLYEFHQTADLASLTWQRSIRGIYELLKTEVMTWVSQVTGLELTSVSASCSLYGPGDHLLVHDDLLGDRRVAFIFYLAPWRPSSAPHQRIENGGAGDHDNAQLYEHGWSPHMGGALELFATDRRGDPTDVVHRVYPRNNMLAFFKVGTTSYHQVAEVLSLELPRLSINGWFHGPAPPLHVPPASPVPRPLPQRPHTETVVMSQWVESTYMSPRCRAQIQTQMERESEVCLRDLLLPDRYTELHQALQQPDIPWERRGPANRRRYSRIPPEWAESLDKEHPIRSLLKLVSSNMFFRLLVDCTDLTVTGFERLEFQKWTAGDYSLLPPRDQYQRPRLEAILYIGVGERPICGGSTLYVAPEEPGGGGGGGGGVGGAGSGAEAHDAALVTLPPHDNALNLVYCDAGAASFTKYISKMTMRDADCFYILTCTYTE